MKPHTFRGPDLATVFQTARRALGDDVMIARTSVVRRGATTVAEVTAVAAHEVERFQRRLEPGPLPTGRGTRPLVIALVGPAGSGKTTTLSKMAVHPAAFGGHRVGVITLDTFRVGALEQLTTIAELARLPLEVVYQAGEAPGALQRLADREVILVDTPGRTPRGHERGQEWGAILDALAPDEVHLVVPAALRPDLCPAVLQAYRPVGPTHLVISKLDEVPGEGGLTDLAVEFDLPARWVTDGHDIPGDLRTATARVLASLGVVSAAPPTRGVA